VKYLSRLSLDRFGVVTNADVDLGPGLTVVFGANEAGKSTLLRALDAAITGRSTTSVHGMPPRDLRLSFILDDTESREPSAYVLSPAGLLSEPDRSSIETPWASALTGWGPWLTTHGVDHAMLRRGGAALLEGRGDLADVVFESHEGFSARNLRQRLVARADALFKKRQGSKSAIAEAMDDYSSDVARREACTVDPAEVSRLRQALTEARVREEASRSVQGTAAAEHRTSERDLAAVAYVPQLLRLRQEESALRELPLLHVTDAHAAFALVEQLATDDSLLAELPQRREELTEQINSSPAEDPVLADESAISDWATDLNRLEARRDEASSFRAAQQEARQRLISCLARLGLAQHWDDDSAILAAAAAVHVADDVRESINARAQTAAHERQAWLTARDATHDAQAQLEARQHALSEAEGFDAGAVSRARATRDLLWSRVTRALLAPETSDPADRQELLTEHAVATAAADLAADEAAVRAHDHATLVELDRRVSEAENAENRRRMALEEAESLWRDLADSAGLPAALTDAGWAARVEVLDAVAEAMSSFTSATSDADIREGEWDTFASDVAEVAERHGVAGDVPGQARSLHARLTTAREARGTHESLTVERDRIDAHIAEVKARHESSLQEWSTLMDRCGLSDEVDMRDRIDRTLALEVAEKALADGRSPLGPLFDHDDELIDLAVSRLADRTDADLAFVVEEAASRLRRAQDDLDQARDARRDAELALRQAEDSDDAIGPAQDAANARSRVVDLVEDYARTMIQIRLLDDRLETLLQTQGSTTIERAGELLEELTGGRYVALSSQEGRAGERSLLLHRRDQSPAAPEELSEGTLDQVFLALRLAALEIRLAQQRDHGITLLPIVLDDILLAFDDERTEQALRTLTEWASDKQVILTTHHAQVRDCAERQGIDIAALPEAALIESLGEPARTRRDLSAPRLTSPSKSGRIDEKELRALMVTWALETDRTPPRRGRIPDALRRDFAAEHPDLVIPGLLD